MKDVWNLGRLEVHDFIGLPRLGGSVGYAG